MEALQENTQAAAAKGESAQDLIFALDIGTRSIIGIVGVQRDGVFQVKGIEMEEHTKRAVIDGQIEDIEQTARTAGRVKARLEEKLGCTLSDVFIAAAGRTLKTQKSQFEMELDPKELIREQQVARLESGAVEAARESLQDCDEEAFYCVGYSVHRYYLDDYPLSTLVDHRGKRARVEIIATFLPNEVVESLYATMDKIRLNVAGLTLEPIAAMNAIVPQELRMLNLALVDVGAGTSDIAISEDGGVSAYTMATVAGDEITEAIIREYLVDFSTAEQMKVAVGQEAGMVDFRDILGFSHTVACQEILQRIEPFVRQLADVIGEKILETNGKAPAAVFLVGGGSRAQGLAKAVAQTLGLEDNKVAVGGNNYMKKMVEAQQDISGPEFATPMGIAITATETGRNGGLKVTINGEKKLIFKRDPIAAVDVLMLCGYKQNQLVGRSGRSLSFMLNGRKKTVRGGYPEAAVIAINGETASLSTLVRSGDEIQFSPANQGADAHATLRDVVDGWEEMEVTFNGAKVRVGAMARLNGVPVTGNQPLQEMDSIELSWVTTAGDLAQEAGLEPEGSRFFVDGQPVDADHLLREGDALECVALGQPTAGGPGQPETQTPQEPAAAAQAGPITVTLNGTPVELYPKADGSPYLFLDMLNFVDMDPSKPQGEVIQRINGREAAYLDVVANGSDIQLCWGKPGTDGR